MAAFLGHGELQCPQIAAESSRARGVSAAFHRDLGEEFVGDPQNIDGRQLSPEKMTHKNSATRFAGRTDRLNPVDALERHPGILLAPELNRGGPVATRRVEEMSRVCAELLLFLEAVAGVGAVSARRKDSPFPAIDRLACLLVRHHYAIGDLLERQ